MYAAGCNRICDRAGKRLRGTACLLYTSNGLYLLDEPEAALSPSRILTLIAEVHELVQQNSQFLIATHSPMLMALSLIHI